jgi:hypothetical protein
VNTRYALAIVAFFALLTVPTAPAAATEAWPPPTFPVRWNPAPLPTFEGAEQPNPWGYQTPDDPAPLWQAYEVSVDEEPRLLYETPRFLRSVTWEPDGTAVRIQASSLGEAFSKYPQPRDLIGLLGFVRIDLRSRAAETVLLQGNWPEVSPDGRKVAFWKGAETYLRQPGKPDVKLDGKGIPFFGWTPDSRSILVWYPDPDVWPSRTGAVYLVPLEDGEARYLATMPQKPVWSHDGMMFAYVSDGDVYVHDLAGRYNRRLTHGQRYFADGTVWSEDDSKLVLGGTVIDVASGAVRASLMQGAVLSRSLSPDARYFMATDQAVGGFDPASERCPRVHFAQNRLLVYDTLTGTTRTQHDCDGTLWRIGSGVLVGSDGRQRAVVSQRDCLNSHCEGGTSRFEMLTFEDGSTFDLGDAEGSVSPDNHALLVSGPVLKVFSRDLELLREIQVPAGKRVQAVSWSPDSQRFVYVVGPA